MKAGKYVDGSLCNNTVSDVGDERMIVFDEVIRIAEKAVVVYFKILSEKLFVGVEKTRGPSE
jgi:hypothetical protein